MVLYDVNVKEPWFSLIKFGLKSVEGRLNKGTFSKFKVQDEIKFHNQGDVFNVEIIKVNHYDTFKQMLEQEELQKCLPGSPSIECGVRVYREFYSEEIEQKLGVLAIQIKKLN